MSDWQEIQIMTTDLESQKRIDQRLAKISSLDLSNPADAEIAMRLQEEIGYLSLRRTLSGGRLGRIIITCALVVGSDGYERLEPLIPYDDNNVVHRLAKEEGWEWPAVSPTPGPTA